MKTTALILTSCALLALPLGAAGAGQCTGEIDNLQKSLAAHDAGSGPTPGAAGSGMGQHPPTTAMSQADQGAAASTMAAQSNKPQHPPTEAMNKETTGTGGPGAAAEPKPAEHPPTAAMNREMQGGAASPQDVQRQNQGQPTAAQEVQAQISESHSKATAMATLERARMLDQHGREAECLSTVGQARLTSGTR